MSKVMVHGTGGNLDYLAIARKGNLVLSIKPNAIAPGENFNVPDVTYFGARLRSAPSLGYFDDDDKAAGITTLASLNPGDPWGGVEWEKQDETRASGQEGVFLRGNLFKDADKVLEAFVTGNITKKFADYLYEKAGSGVTFVATKEELSGWLEETFAPRLKQIAQGLAKKKALDSEVSAKVEGSIGIFASQTSLLKGIFKKHGIDVDPENDVPVTDNASAMNQANVIAASFGASKVSFKKPDAEPADDADDEIPD
jgi:hypothetical protein